jgi:hypothetical protein
MARAPAAVLLAFVSAFGCQAGGPSEERLRPSPPSTPGAEARAKAGDERKVFGAAISSAPGAELAEVLREPERFSGKNVVVSGHVRRACTRMGCWMELAAGSDPSTPACRVTFHGHGFFVPKDSAGSDARVEGRLEIVKVSAAHAAHLEEEGARVADKGDDGSAREVHLDASGVELFRRGG